ncbi:unnamed protein product [Adineta steineri]|uniref:Isopenicillin N synthase-like Fe(2+) 2OG dioxygenase domain-containing protein n=1 Tax=Adineta steineri TaxID=433720 RepID=A0A818U0F0_9BILA|nr:unnamed protein product [Adineta steineri]
MVTEFELNGWCFVYLPAELIPNSNMIDEISNFFTTNTGTKIYSQPSAVYGFTKVKHKEGIKLLTGSHFSRLANRGLVPSTLIQPLNYLSQALDAVTKRLIEILDQHEVFQQQPSLLSLNEHADLPFQDEHFGMLDVVKYFNDKNGFQPPENGETTEEVNCVPHYDPGLLSISILSTCEGLQLKNLTNNEWIDGPLEPSIGVIWLGEAASLATQNRLKPGIHRVIYPHEPKCRLTIWYELCTTEQLRNISGKQKNAQMREGFVSFGNLPESAPIAVLPGESKLDFLKRIEMGRGLSLTKTGRINYTLEKHTISFPTNDSSTTENTIF